LFSITLDVIFPGRDSIFIRNHNAYHKNVWGQIQKYSTDILHRKQFIFFLAKIRETKTLKAFVERRFSVVRRPGLRSNLLLENLEKLWTLKLHFLISNRTIFHLLMIDTTD